MENICILLCLPVTLYFSIIFSFHIFRLFIMDDNDFEDTEEYLEYAEVEGNADLGKCPFVRYVLQRWAPANFFLVR